jgi:hypothetical protein
MPKRAENRLLAYLEAKGVLTNGTPDDIAAAKREYRKLYQQEYKRSYLTGHSEVRFTLASSITQSIDAAAHQIGIDRSTYAKEATLARLSGKPHGARVSKELLQKVALIHSEVRHLCRQRPAGLLDRHIVFGRLEKRVADLEEAFRESLQKDQ